MKGCDGHKCAVMENSDGDRKTPEPVELINACLFAPVYGVSEPQADPLKKQNLSAICLFLIIMITEICKAPTPQLKVMNNITHIMYIEMDNVISNLTKANT